MNIKSKIDTIGREEIVERLYTVIESVSENKGNVSFALDGLWGSGKTFVIDMLENKLNSIKIDNTNNNKYFVIHYNCWQYDYYEEPLLAIVSSMIETIDKTEIIMSNDGKALLKNVIVCIGKNFIADLNTVVKKHTDIDVKEKVSSIVENIKNAHKDTKDKIKENHENDNYFQFKKTLKNFRDVLEELSKKSTVVFVVDELDRCLPEYSIKVLERLHHLTEDIDNTITLIATDKSKLCNTISNIYGFNDNEDICSKYLKKFIKFSVNLEIGQSKDNIKEKYAEYLSLFENKLFTDNINFIDFFNALFYDIDVREQENIMEQILLIHKLSINEEKCDKSLMYLEMICYVIENYYRLKISDVYDGKDFKSYITKERKETLKKFIILNNVSLPETDRFNDFKTGNLFHLSRHNNINVFIRFILAYIIADDVKPQIYDSSGYCIPQGKYNEYLTQLNNFRELAKIIK